MPSYLHILDPNGYVAQFDASTHALINITYAHHEIHSGSSFVVSELSQLDDTDTREWLIETPDTTTWAHMILDIEGSLDTQIDMYESTTKTTGTAMTEVNRNRNSANAATVVVTHTPGGAGDGTIVWTRRFGNDTGPAGRGGGGGSARGINEWELKQNTKYLIRVTSHSDANNISFAIDWYERADRD